VWFFPQCSTKEEEEEEEEKEEEACVDTEGHLQRCKWVQFGDHAYLA
jgi:hypothetical protein